MNWANSDIIAADVRMPVVISKDKFAAMIEYDKVVIFTRIPDEEVLPKYIIKLVVTDYGDSDVIKKKSSTSTGRATNTASSLKITSIRERPAKLPLISVCSRSTERSPREIIPI
jgi:hypothetical protein